MFLELIRRTRKKPQLGDLFYMKAPGHGYVWGRVVGQNLRINVMQLPYLVFVYSHLSPHPVPPGELDYHALLIPPCFTNHMGWSLGYCSTYENRPLTQHDRPDRICVRNSFVERYTDEYGRPMERAEPCTEDDALSMFGYIDAQIAEALASGKGRLQPSSQPTQEAPATRKSRGIKKLK